VPLRDEASRVLFHEGCALGSHQNDGPHGGSAVFALLAVHHNVVPRIQVRKGLLDHEEAPVP